MIKVSKSELERVLTEELGLREPRFKLEKSGDWWNGSVISETFRRKGDSQRQKMIWDALRRALGPDSPRRVGMLLAYTPEEWDIDDLFLPLAPAKPGMRKPARAGSTK